MCRKKIYLAAVAMFFALSCSLLDAPSQQGSISLRFSDVYNLTTRGGVEVPDTNDFILTVTSADGKTIYNGKYGDAPESLSVKSGSYTVKAVSREFSAPAFDCPQYGDEQVVVVPSEGGVQVCLDCRMMNAGIRLVRSSDFLAAYPSGVLFVKSGNEKLMYSYTEKRVAYFAPGIVSVLLSDSSQERTLLSRTLESCSVLTIVLSVSSDTSPSVSSRGGIHIKLDTSRTYLSENYLLGSSAASKGNDYKNALTISQAKASIGESGVWVYGYIVGGDLTSSSTGISFEPPFSSATNIAIASRSSVTTKSSCMSVQLPSGEVREGLNLTAHPGLLKTGVYVKGDIVSSYYGIPGIKNVSEYVLKE